MKKTREAAGRKCYFSSLILQFECANQAIKYLRVKEETRRSTIMNQSTQKIRLAQLATDIQNTLRNRFEGQPIWISAQITDVKKQNALRRCYLKFIEKDGNETLAEIRGVFWTNAYSEIERFEQLTGKSFSDGLEINCSVLVKFHPRFGLSLEVQEIEIAYALGSLELERQQTLERLVKEFPKTIQVIDGEFFTLNKSLPMPPVIQKIALITAVNSDGQRDFIQELRGNKFGYSFEITEFLTQIQGDQAHQMIIQQLELIQDSNHPFDVVAIVRGGGSQTDFKPFDHFDLAACVAHFPIPVLTGIGHDRNTSITDLMGRQEKTPTKVAAKILDHNFEWENQLMFLKERFFQGVINLLRNSREELSSISRMIRAVSPETILSKGFTIIHKSGKMVTDPTKLQKGDNIDFQLKSYGFSGVINEKTEIKNT